MLSASTVDSGNVASPSSDPRYGVDCGGGAHSTAGLHSSSSARLSAAAIYHSANTENQHSAGDSQVRLSFVDGQGLTSAIAR